jgi:hypothetical protein
VAGGRPVILTPLRSKLQPDPFENPSRLGGPRASEIPEIPQAGAALREAIFSLAPKA